MAAGRTPAFPMPELPEVELVTRFLDRIVRGRRIESAVLLRERLAPDSPPKLFAGHLAGSMINFVHRRGKHILFDLDNGKTLLTHLRMSGRFMLLANEAELPKFAHAVLELDNDEKLVFQDQRHFGFMRVAQTSAVAHLPEIRKLAPEPFSDQFSADYLHISLKRSARTLKEFLLDQSRVCGLGNIYAAEAMFRAEIHPSQRTNKLSKPRAARLHQSIQAILNEAIEGGSTLNADPTDSNSAYYGGAFERHWRVYDREGEPCLQCGTAIKRLKHAGRSSYFCPSCQKR
jgi:formamidopyrimidine-DNA glycosylase